FSPHVALRPLHSFPTRRSSDLVPPLRERRDDILPLARTLLDEAARRLDRKIARIAPEAAERMLGYAWPGNVRELANAVERAVARSEEHTSELQSRGHLVCRLLL